MQVPPCWQGRLAHSSMSGMNTNSIKVYVYITLQRQRLPKKAPNLVHTNTNMHDLPVPHVVPSYPLAQVHMYLFTRSVQVPPCWQGWLTHSSMSGIKKSCVYVVYITCLFWMINIVIRLAEHCSKNVNNYSVQHNEYSNSTIYDLLVPQVVPSYPLAQVHVYPFTRSVQVPPCRQGRLAHSSMSAMKSTM